MNTMRFNRRIFLVNSCVLHSSAVAVRSELPDGQISPNLPLGVEGPWSSPRFLKAAVRFRYPIGPFTLRARRTKKTSNKYHTFFSVTFKLRQGTERTAGMPGIPFPNLTPAIY